MLQLRVFLGRKCRIYALFFVANIAITRFLGWNFWQKFVRNSQKYSEFWQKFWGKNWPLEPLCGTLAQVISVYKPAETNPVVPKNYTRHPQISVTCIGAVTDDHWIHIEQHQPIFCSNLEPSLTEAWAESQSRRFCCDNQTRVSLSWSGTEVEETLTGDWLAGWSSATVKSGAEPRSAHTNTAHLFKLHYLGFIFISFGKNWILQT